MKFIKDWQEKVKQFNTITSVLSKDLITPTDITRGASIAAFARSDGLPVGIALSGTALHTTKNTAISPNFLVWKFCGNAQFPHSFR